ncbi:MAG TPA: GNAT family N-acyltransferase [Bryobacteraceae bacterium]|nr:GNAT family N-acyltransferase [Bryobacteraceae bacterium]
MRASGGGGDALGGLISALGIEVRAGAEALSHIPAKGPAVVVANHPFGLLEGAVLTELLSKIRPDVRILANSLLAAIPELREKCIFVDPFGRKGLEAANALALRECLRWLRQGGMLAAFPSGEVAHVVWKRGVFHEPPWNPAIARIAQLGDAAAVPVFFKGANSVLFQLAGGVHAGLRTASLPRELLNKRGRSVEVRVGRPVSAALLKALPDAQAAIEYLRCRTYALDAGGDHLERRAPAANAGLSIVRGKHAIAPASPHTALAAEIARLPQGARLCEGGELTAYLATYAGAPNVVREIGRLREIAFRQVGEGVGRSIDLDAFDRYYLHLFLWNETAQEIAGAYRLGPTPDILPRYGARGLYTSTLFRYRPGFFERLGPAVELGRSFVRLEYQKQYAPLLLLWKGIGRYVATRPECATLFGGVSISNDYRPFSRRLMVRYLESHPRTDLAGMAAPRKAFRPAARPFREPETPPRAPAGINELSALIEDWEGDGKGVPILIKQYLKTGGKLVACNVDRRFSNALDALIAVDMRQLPGALLERYLGKPGADSFCAWHALRRGAA